MAVDQPVVETKRSVPNALKVIVLLLSGLVLLLFLWKVRSVVLMLFLAVIAGVALARATDWLEKAHIRRGIGAPLAMLLLIGALAGTIAAIAPTVREQTKDLTTEVPKAFEKVRGWLENMGIPLGALGGGAAAEGGAGSGQEKQPAASAGGEDRQEPGAAGGGEGGSGEGEPGGIQSGVAEVVSNQGFSGVGRIVFPVISSVFEAVAGILIIIFVAIYIAISPRTYYDGVIHLVPHPKRDRAHEVLTDLGETLRGWLTARLIAMVVIGVVTGGALALLGVRAAVALGVIAGLMELIPFYGPIIAAIPAIGVALVESPQQALYVVILYLLIQQFEGNLLTPLLLKSRLELPPVMTIVAVTSLGLIFGVIGMLAAEPLVASVMLLVRKLYVRDVIGDDIEKHDEDDDEDDEEKSA